MGSLRLLDFSFFIPEASGRQTGNIYDFIQRPISRSFDLQYWDTFLRSPGCARLPNTVKIANDAAHGKNVSSDPAHQCQYITAGVNTPSSTR